MSTCYNTTQHTLVLGCGCSKSAFIRSPLHLNNQYHCHITSYQYTVPNNTSTETFRHSYKLVVTSPIKVIKISEVRLGYYILNEPAAKGVGVQNKGCWYLRVSTFRSSSVLGVGLLIRFPTAQKEKLFYLNKEKGNESKEKRKSTSDFRFWLSAAKRVRWFLFYLSTE